MNSDVIIPLCFSRVETATLFRHHTLNHQNHQQNLPQSIPTIILKDINLIGVAMRNKKKLNLWLNIQNPRMVISDHTLHHLKFYLKKTLDVGSLHFIFDCIPLMRTWQWCSTFDIVPINFWPLSQCGKIHMLKRNTWLSMAGDAHTIRFDETNRRHRIQVFQMR